MAHRIGDPSALVAALESRHAALLHIAHLDERLALDDELLALAGRIGERELEALGHHWRIYDLLEAGDVEEARARARRAGRARRRSCASRCTTTSPSAGRSCGRRWPAAWRRPSGSRARPTSSAARAGARRRHDLRRPDADAAPARGPARRVRLDRRDVRRAPPRAGRVAGGAAARAPARAASARRAWRPSRTWRATTSPRSRATCSGSRPIASLGEACALIGDARARRGPLPLLLPHRDRMVQVTQAACFGSTHRFLGLLRQPRGRLDAAGRALRGRAGASTRGAACCRVVPFIRAEYAQMLLAAPGARRRRARALLVPQALAEAEAAGITCWSPACACCWRLRRLPAKMTPWPVLRLPPIAYESDHIARVPRGHPRSAATRSARCSPRAGWDASIAPSAPTAKRSRSSS